MLQNENASGSGKGSARGIERENGTEKGKGTERGTEIEIETGKGKENEQESATSPEIRHLTFRKRKRRSAPGAKRRSPKDGGLL
jgi:hypothetical protein